MAENRDAALAGRRVLELVDEKGAYCGKLLADMGADVIKIEPPGGDATRRIPPFASAAGGEVGDRARGGGSDDLPREPGSEDLVRAAGSDDRPLAPGNDDLVRAAGGDDLPLAPGSDNLARAQGSGGMAPDSNSTRDGGRHSLFFLYMNTSKRAVTLDLAAPEGRELFTRLAAGADVVLESLPPGYLDALGLGYLSLKKSNKRLVLTSISGFGASGPYKDYRCCDLVASATGGALYVTGEAEDPPVTLAGSQANVTASVTAAASTMIALYAASISGEGQHVDISIEEATAAASHICGVGKWLDDGMVPRRRGSGLFASVPSGAYRCRDGLIYLMVNRPLHWKALAAWINEVTGNCEVLDPMFEGPSSKRIEHRELLDIFIGELCARYSVEEIYHEGQRRHIALTPVNSAAAVARDEHLAARGYFVELEHPGAGVLRYPGAPYRHSLTPWRMSRPAPAPGEHNAEVLGRELGLSAAELSALARAGVV